MERNKTQYHTSNLFACDKILHLVLLSRSSRVRRQAQQVPLVRGTEVVKMAAAGRAIRPVAARLAARLVSSATAGQEGPVATAQEGRAAASRISVTGETIASTASSARPRLAVAAVVAGPLVA